MTHGLNKLEILDGNRRTGVILFETPSPSSIIFVLPEGTATKLGRQVAFTDFRQAMHACPCAYQLLAQKDSDRRPIVTQVTVGDHEKAAGRAYITVTLADPSLWKNRAVLGIVERKIIDLLKTGRPLVNADALEGEKKFPQLKTMFMAAGEKPDVAEHKAVIDIYNRATVSTHGGRIEYVSFDPAKGHMRVFFDSACNSCHSTDGTRKGLQDTFKKMQDARLIARAVNSIEVLKERPRGLNA